VLAAENAVSDVGFVQYTCWNYIVLVMYVYNVSYNALSFKPFQENYFELHENSKHQF